MRPLLVIYVAVALADLVALASGHVAWRSYSKPALMLILAAGVVVMARGRLDRSRAALAIGLIASSAGDAALLRTSDAAFVLGTACFAVTHVCYITAFALVGTGPGLVRRRPWLVLPYAGAWLAATVLLWPHLGTLAYAVVPYSALLTVMAVAALNLVGRIPQRDAILVAAGGVFFMSSDTTLALARFAPALAQPHADLVVMLTYVIAQLLIVCGLAARPGKVLPEAVRR